MMLDLLQEFAIGVQTLLAVNNGAIFVRPVERVQANMQAVVQNYFGNHMDVSLSSPPQTSELVRASLPSVRAAVVIVLLCPFYAQNALEFQQEFPFVYRMFGRNRTRSMKFMDFNAQFLTVGAFQVPVLLIRYSKVCCVFNSSLLLGPTAQQIANFDVTQCSANNSQIWWIQNNYDNLFGALFNSTLLTWHSNQHETAMYNAGVLKVQSRGVFV